jgi:hypothetical protein
MRYFLLLTLLTITLTLSSCASLNSTILSSPGKYKVFVVDKEPTKCEVVSNVRGIGTEAFEGNTRYTIPLAMTNIKQKTLKAGGNVLYIQNAYKSGTSYVIDGTCYKCMTKIVRRKGKRNYKVTRQF